MTILIEIFRRYFWFLYPNKTLYEGEGLYSKVKITKKGDWTYMYTGNSYMQTALNEKIMPQGNHFDWYLIAPWFSGMFKGILDQVLIMGLGCGAQVKSYNKMYDIKQITGIEIDPLIINLGIKYFNLADKNLKTLAADSYEYISNATEKYDLIIIDSFKENKFDLNCQNSIFCKNIHNALTNEGVAFINKLKDDPNNLDLVKNLKENFTDVISLTVKYCTFYIATNAPSAPKSTNDIKTLINNAIHYNQSLRFFRSTKLSKSCNFY